MSTPDPVDIAVGKQIRKIRKLRHMTQTQLGDAAGCQFQQIQKYETGVNRVSASRLHGIARALSVPIERFFDATETTTDMPIADAITLSTMTAMSKLPDQQRHAILTLARQLAE